MEQTIKIDRIDRYAHDKAGKPLVSSKSNKPYERVTIDPAGGRRLSGFGGAWNRDWKVGDTVRVVITESDKTDVNGQPYLNFAQVDEMTALVGKLNVLEKFVMERIVDTLKNHEDRIKALEPKPTITGTDIPYPTPEDEGINLDEPPF